MKILVAVLSARRRPYPWLVRTIERTWASADVPGAEVVFYFGGAPERLVRGRRVFLPAGDGLEATGEKTLALFEYALERLAFDLLFRTNASSYVDLPNLGRFVDAAAQPGAYYAGFVGRHEGRPFASGSGYFLSRDLVELALSERPSWRHSLLDDVALAEALARHGIEPVELPRQDISSPEAVSSVDTSLFHFRCKTTGRFRTGDVRIMLGLHRAFLRSRGQRVPPSLRARELQAMLLDRALRLAARARALMR